MLNVFEKLAAQGRFKALKVLIGACPKSKLITPRLMDIAAMYGHIDIVKWLHENRTEGFTLYGLDMACYYEHDDVLAFLKLHIDDDSMLSDKLRKMDSFAFGPYQHFIGDIESVKCIGKDYPSSMAMAAVYGDLDMLMWMYEQGYSRENLSRGMVWAMLGNHFDVVEWLHGKGVVPIGNVAVIMSARYGNLDMLKWIRDNIPSMFNGQDLWGAAFTGRIDIAKFLYENGERNLTHAINIAVKYGKGDLVKYLTKLVLEEIRSEIVFIEE